MKGYCRLRPEIAESIALAEQFTPNGYITKSRTFAAAQDAQRSIRDHSSQKGNGPFSSG